MPIKAAALHFSLAHPAVAAVIPGSSRPGRIAEDVAAMKFAVPEDFWRDLRDSGVVSAAAPLPVDDEPVDHRERTVEAERGRCPTAARRRGIRSQPRHGSVPDVPHQVSNLVVDAGDGGRGDGGEAPRVDGRHHRDVVKGVGAASEAADHRPAAVGEGTWFSEIAAPVHHHPVVYKAIVFVKPWGCSWLADCLAFVRHTGPVAASE